MNLKKKKEIKKMNKMKTTIKLKQKNDSSKTMKVEVRGHKILSSKGFIKDVKYQITTRIDIVEERYNIPEPYQI